MEEGGDKERKEEEGEREGVLQGEVREWEKDKGEF